MPDEREPVISSAAVARGSDGRFYVAAEDVIAILRGFARVWTRHAEQQGAAWRSPEGEEVELDAETLRALARILTQEADNIEVQFIAEATEEGWRPDATG